MDGSDFSELSSHANAFYFLLRSPFGRQGTTFSGRGVVANGQVLPLAALVSFISIPHSCTLFSVTLHLIAFWFPIFNPIHKYRFSLVLQYESVF